MVNVVNCGVNHGFMLLKFVVYYKRISRFQDQWVIGTDIVEKAPEPEKDSDSDAKAKWKLYIEELFLAGSSCVKDGRVQF